MTPNRQHQIQSIFEDGLQVAADQRSRFLDEQCGDDAELRAEVESLLARLEDGQLTSSVVDKLEEQP